MLFALCRHEFHSRLQLGSSYGLCNLPFFDGLAPVADVCRAFSAAKFAFSPFYFLLFALCFLLFALCSLPFALCCHEFHSRLQLGSSYGLCNLLFAFCPLLSAFCYLNFANYWKMIGVFDARNFAAERFNIFTDEDIVNFEIRNVAIITNA